MLLLLLVFVLADFTTREEEPNHGARRRAPHLTRQAGRTKPQRAAAAHAGHDRALAEPAARRGAPQRRGVRVRVARGAAGAVFLHAEQAQEEEGGGGGGSCTRDWCAKDV